MKIRQIKKINASFVTVVMLLSVISAMTILPTVNADTIYVYHGGSIQDAIDAANPGDTVFVYNGTYYENIVIDKSISLIGEDKDTTIIDGEGIGDVISVTSAWVNISGFTIQNSSVDLYNPGSGIRLNSTNYVKITDNNINNNAFGILLYSSSNNNIISNSITNNSNHYYYGIVLVYSSNNNNIANNIVANNDIGISLDVFCNNNKIIDNEITNNNHSIYLDSSSNNTVTDNDVNNNMCGILLLESNHNTITYNNITDNKEGGVIITWLSSNNSIYHNNLINNTQNTYDEGNNIWYNPDLKQGNYYDDYTEKYPNATQTINGTWDTPYNITGGSAKDYYPLINPYGSVTNIDTGRVFLTIQSAIDANETLDGHTIMVTSGTYHENIVIDKSISLIGEDKDTTVIDGSGLDYVVNISTDWVNISGFTIQNSSSSFDYDFGGIILYSTDYIKITDNNIKNNAIGISLQYCSNNSITDNYIINNTYGIHSKDSNNNIITGNDASNNKDVGIYLEYRSSFNNISGNTLNHNGQFGIILAENSNYNNVTDNIINNTIVGGIIIVMSHYNTVAGNTVINTAINYTNSSSPLFGVGIAIIACSYNNILDNNLENNHRGIYATSAFSGDPTAFNTIAGNNIKNNYVYGICIEEWTPYVYVYNNTIYHNNLINNTENAYDNSSNIWYNETLQQGNYYDDYTEKYPNATQTINGTWDTPYNITGGDNQDLYPLIEPYTKPEGPEPKLEVNIHTGLFRLLYNKINATVQNTGNGTANNVNLTLSVEYGLLGLKKANKTMNIISLPSHESQSIEITGLCGFGFIGINITAFSDETEKVTDTATGLIIGPFIILGRKFI